MATKEQYDDLVKRIERLETILLRIESKLGGSAPGGATGGATGSAALDAWDKLINDFYKNFVELSKKLGGDVATQVALLDKVVAEIRKFLETASKTPKPDDTKLGELLGPASSAIGAVKEFQEKNRKSKQANHLNTLGEGVAAFGWVAQSLPAPYIGETLGSSQFWSNKILTEFKGKDQTQVDWVNAFNSFLKEMQAYAKYYHTQGVAWKK